MSERKGLDASAHTEKPPSCQEALNLLFDAATHMIPYLEHCYRQCEVGTQDWFEIPKTLEEVYRALEAGRSFRGKGQT